MGVLIAATIRLACAADYPTRAVRIVVPFPAGATNDIVARLYARKLAAQTGRPFVVDNRPGGSGIPGAEFVAQARPDGYTLLLGNTSLLGIQPNLYAKLPYDPSEFVPVSVLAVTPSVLVVHPSLPVTTVAELVAYAKVHPGKLNYASAGNGSPFHLSAELFKAQTGTIIVHVPYRGGAPALAGLLAGEVHLMFNNLPPVLPYVRSGKVRAIAATGAARLPQLPDVPTLAEAGFKNTEWLSWFALVAPRDTPKDVVERLHHAIAKAAGEPDVRKRLYELGAVPVGNSPEEAAAHIRAAVDLWERLIRESGATVDD